MANPSYIPDGAFELPTYSVSLESPLPDPTTFIGSIASSAFPPFLGVVSVLISISIMKAIIQAFKK